MKTTGMLNSKLFQVRLGHILAHIRHQEDTFPLIESQYVEFLSSAQTNAIRQIKSIRGHSEEMDKKEVRPLYEELNRYGIPYPNEKGEHDVDDWIMAFYALVREAAVTYTIMAGRCPEIDEALEYSTFAINLWHIHTELVRGTAVSALRDQIEFTLSDWQT